MVEEVYLALGSNLGDREQNLGKAIEALRERKGIRYISASSFYESAPVGVEDQPDFLNAAVKIETGLSPLDLLAATQAIESELGRKKTVRWGPRIIDIDILLYGREKICEEGLVVPHPRMTERPFVLLPLREIASNLDASLYNIIEKMKDKTIVTEQGNGIKRIGTT